MGDVLAWLAWMAFDFLVVGMGRLAVRLVSFNSWRGEAWGGDEGRHYAPAGSLSFVLQGRRIITYHGLFGAGLMAWVMVVVGVYWVSA